MILIFGGTTEGRMAVAALDRAGKPFFYSTRSDLQQVESKNAVRITGSLDSGSIIMFCRDNDIRLIVDAAHPFASQLHENIHLASESLAIPVIRIERRYPDKDLSDSVVWCDGYDDAVNKMNAAGVSSLLALSGVQTISKLKEFWISHECYFRILNRQESLEKVTEAGFPIGNTVFYDEKDGSISQLISDLHPDAIITKESGDSGGYSQKIEEATAAGLKVYVVRRPPMPEGFITVTGEYGLRKSVEKLFPGFFDLRSGFTTGTCATAAATAALFSLMDDNDILDMSVSLPNGEVVSLPVKNVDIISETTASASVVKDAGDDPDVTNGVEIVATVSLAKHGKVRFFGGEGIGTVTLPGLGLPVGSPAINPVPRKMMTEALLRLHPEGCDVTISVSGGEELAKKTFNPRIGVVGGISIIGTSGVVMPFSNEAFLESIHREMEVAAAVGCHRIVINSGARSEKSVRTMYPELPEAAFIHYGNAIGETLKIAKNIGFKDLTVGLMLGKAVKLAEGNLDTHSHKVTMNRQFLTQVAEEAGCSEIAIDTILHLNMARELWQSLSDDDADHFFPALLRLCKEYCRRLFPHGNLQILLIDDGGIIKYKLSN